MKKVIMLISVLLLTTHTYAASFDCKKANTKTEKTICSDSDLSSLDEELGSLYVKAITLVSYKDELKQQQRDWVKKVRNACTDDSGCLQREYKARLAAFNSTLDAPKYVRAPESRPNDQDAIISAIQIMQLKQPYPHENDKKAKHDESQFCSEFIVDLKAGKSVDFVEPIVVTDDYNYPVLQHLITKCPKLKPFKSVYWLPRIWRYLQESKTPKEEWEDSGTVTYASYDFKMYHTAFDGKNNENEYVFFGNGVVKTLDLNICKVLEETSISESTIDRKTKQYTGARNGILKYKAKFYIYDLFGELSILYLHGFNKHLYCTYKKHL